MPERRSIPPPVEVDNHVVMYTNYFGWVICHVATMRITHRVVDREAGIALARTALGASPTYLEDGQDD